MQIEDKLAKMSGSIAYWYMQPHSLKKYKSKVIFPVEPRLKNENYQLLRLKHNDSNVIIGPNKQVYEITKDISVELEQKSYMVFLKNVSKNQAKIQAIEKIQA